MGKPAEVEFHRFSRRGGYSATVRTALAFSALVVTLLPIPVTYLGILPAYRLHAPFLLFFAPFVCLLTLCYLFYVRDSLARAIFADVLDPPPAPDPYYREPRGERLKRGLRRAKAAVLGVLPILLVMISMYCLSRYLGSLNDSIAAASQAYGRASAAAEIGTTSGQRGRGTRARTPPPTVRSRAQRVESLSTASDTLPPPSDSTAVRSYVLRTSRIDAIPGVVELTALYVGAFVTLLIAVTLMALKEYAKEALGLSEQELMLGGYNRAGPDE